MSAIASPDIHTLEAAPRFAASSPHQHVLGRVEPSELKFVIFAGSIICLLTSFPYWLGSRLSTPDHVFTGVLEYSADANNYLAYAHQAEMGQWLFHNPMTGEPHGNVFFNLEWLLIGKLARMLNAPLPVGTNILRLFATVLMIYGVYWLSSFFLRSRLLRQIALMGIMMGGGFGWIAAVHLFHIPLDSSYFLDLTHANLFPFYWALKLPHFIVSEALIVLGACFFLHAENRGRAHSYVLAGVCYIAGGTCRPYDMLFAMAATSAYVVLSCAQKKKFDWVLLRLLPVLMCIPALAYYYWIFKVHPVFRWWSLPGGQAPPPSLLVLGFGMTSVCLALSLWKLRGRHNPQTAFLLCSLFFAVVLTYSHCIFHFAYQFATNLLVPAVLLILIAWEDSILRFYRKGHRGKLLVIALVTVNSLTSLSLAAQALVLVKAGNFRVDGELLAGYSWLNSHSHPDELVLADFPVSNQLPQYIHNRVFCGYANAVQFSEKESELHRFFAPIAEPGFREELVRRNAIRWVVLTHVERESMGSLADETMFREAFHNSALTIFEVAPSSLRASEHR